MSNNNTDTKENNENIKEDEKDNGEKDPNTPNIKSDSKKNKKEKKEKKKENKQKDKKSKKVDKNRSSTSFHMAPLTKNFGKVIISFSQNKEGFLNFKIGDEIAILSQSNNNIWLGSCKGETGLFDYNCIQLISSNKQTIKTFEPLILYFNELKYGRVDSLIKAMSEQKRTITNVLLKILVAKDHLNRIINFLEYEMDHEIYPENLFKSTTAFFCCEVFFQYFLDCSFLKEALTNIVTVAGKFDCDNERSEEGEKNLIFLANELLFKISTINMFPSELLLVVKAIQKKLLEKQDESQTERIVIRFILSVLICPFISFPEGFGVLDEGLIIPPNVRKILVNISVLIEKAIKVTAKIGDEDVKREVNPFEENIYLYVSNFLGSMNLCQDTYSSNRETDPNILETVQDFHRNISFNLTKILYQINHFFQNDTSEGQKLFNLVKGIGPPYTPQLIKTKNEEKEKEKEKGEEKANSHLVEKGGNVSSNFGGNLSDKMEKKNKMEEEKRELAKSKKKQELERKEDKKKAEKGKLNITSQQNLIDLSNFNISEFPNISYPQYVTTLDLSKNNLSMIPPFISQFVNLQQFFAQKNKLLTLPIDQFTKLPLLSTLSLFSNPFIYPLSYLSKKSNAPHTIWFIKNLNMIDIYSKASNGTINDHDKRYADLKDYMIDSTDEQLNSVVEFFSSPEGNISSLVTSSKKKKSNQVFLKYQKRKLDFGFPLNPSTSSIPSSSYDFDSIPMSPHRIPSNPNLPFVRSNSNISTLSRNSEIPSFFSRRDISFLHEAPESNLITNKSHIQSDYQFRPSKESKSNSASSSPTTGTSPTKNEDPMNFTSIPFKYKKNPPKTLPPSPSPPSPLSTSLPENKRDKDLLEEEEDDNKNINNEDKNISKEGDNKNSNNKEGDNNKEGNKDDIGENKGEMTKTIHPLSIKQKKEVEGEHSEEIHYTNPLFRSSPLSSKNILNLSNDSIQGATDNHINNSSPLPGKNSHNHNLEDKDNNDSQGDDKDSKEKNKEKDSKDNKDNKNNTDNNDNNDNNDNGDNNESKDSKNSTPTTPVLSQNQETTSTPPNNQNAPPPLPKKPKIPLKKPNKMSFSSNYTDVLSKTKHQSHSQHYPHHHHHYNSNPHNNPLPPSSLHYRGSNESPPPLPPNKKAQSNDNVIYITSNKYSNNNNDNTNNTNISTNNTNNIKNKNTSPNFQYGIPTLKTNFISSPSPNNGSGSGNGSGSYPFLSPPSSPSSLSFPSPSSLPLHSPKTLLFTSPLLPNSQAPIRKTIKDSIEITNQSKEKVKFTFNIPKMRAAELKVEPISQVLMKGKTMVVNFELFVLCTARLSELISVTVESPHSTTLDFLSIHLESEISIDLDFNEIEVKDRVGTGGSAAVFWGFWRGKKVAIKKLLDLTNQQETNQEITILAKMNHPCIVQFYGSAINEGVVNIVTEFLEKGSLDHVLYDHKEDMSWSLRAKMALDTSKAIHYLHQFYPPVIHRDLKSSNLLVNSMDINAAVNIKICDFGTSREVSKTMTGAQGTPLWMAPEVFSNQNYTESADIWSLGIIMGEMASRKAPYDGYSLWDSVDAIRKGVLPDIPPETPPKFALIRNSCLQKDHKKRPKASHIAFSITTLLKDFEKNLTSSRLSTKIEDSTISSISSTTLSSNKDEDSLLSNSEENDNDIYHDLNEKIELNEN